MEIPSPIVGIPAVCLVIILVWDFIRNPRDTHSLTVCWLVLLLSLFVGLAGSVRFNPGPAIRFHADVLPGVGCVWVFAQVTHQFSGNSTARKMALGGMFLIALLILWFVASGVWTSLTA